LPAGTTLTTLAGTNAWVLSNDEATAAEQAEVKEKEDKVLLRNKEFEKNKEEFCTNFITDMEDRKKKNSHCQEARECGHLTHQGQQLFVSRPRSSRDLWSFIWMR
jgi:dihydroxyacetone kinase-like predicted kinase